MKKALVLISIASAVILCASSCAKSCNCTAKFNGEVILEDVVDLEEGEKCSDFNGKISVAGVSAERECTYNVF